MTSMAKTRVKRVFNSAVKNMAEGKQPNISTEMAKQGYSPSYSRALGVVRTETWKELLGLIDEESILRNLNDIACSKDDKRATIAASSLLMRLGDRFPANKSQVITLFDKLSELEKEG